MTEPLDSLPESLEEAETEHAEVLSSIQARQQVLQNTNQEIESLAKRGIFLEGVIKAWSKDA